MPFQKLLLLHSPTPPLATFRANECFPGESEFIREMESRIPRLPAVTGTARPAWQADHPRWSSARPARLRTTGPAGGGGRQSSLELALCCWDKVAHFASFRGVVW